MASKPSAETAKTTRLYEWHMGQGANMACFGRYMMPLWYPEGAKNEHLRVLSHAGIFDTSHMSVVMVQGPGAREVLQRCFSADLGGPAGNNPETGRCVYGVFLNFRGHVLDDAIVFPMDSTLLMVVVNAGMGAPVAAHLRTQANNSDAVVTDLSDRVGKLDLQGPESAEILAGILMDPKTVLARMPYFGFKGHFDGHTVHSNAVRLTDGTPVLLSRTGYTGEFGFELFVDPEKFVGLWQMILEAGAPKGLLPCGLAARDSLRAGAGLPLSHQDIGAWPFLNNPWTFALPWKDDKNGFTKSFVGDRALLAAEGSDFTSAFVGFDLRKVSTQDPAVVTDETGGKLGSVLTCVTDMAIGWHDGRVYSVASGDKPSGFRPRGLCCGFIRTARQLAPGTEIRLQDHHRSIPATVVTQIRPARTARSPMSDFYHPSGIRNPDRRTESALPVT